MKIIVNDANILIDLIDINLLGLFFDLPYGMNITDLVRNEFDDETFSDLAPYVRKGALTIHHLDQDATDAVRILKKKFSAALSFPDCSCLQLAQTFSGTVLTGDKPLRSAAETMNLSVHGILWVFDQLIKNKITTPKIAYRKLSQLMTINQRLPKTECSKRLKLWGKE